MLSHQRLVADHIDVIPTLGKGLREVQNYMPPADASGDDRMAAATHQCIAQAAQAMAQVA